MGDVLKYLKSYKLEAIFAPLLKMTEALLELFVPIVISQIIDIGISSADKGYVINRALILLLLAFLGLIFSVTAQYFSAKAAVGMATDLKSSLFKHIQSFSYSDLDAFGTSTLITRMTSDVNQVQSGVNLTLRLFLRSPFIVFGAMIMAFTLDVKSAFIFLVTIIILAVVVFSIIGITIPRYKNVQEKLDNLLLTVRENLSGVRVIRAFCKETSEKDVFDNKNNALNGVQRAVGRISSLMNPITLVVINLAVIAILWTGAVKVDSGALTKGIVVALYNYMAQILVELIKLANLIVTLTKATASSKRISNVFKTSISSNEAGGKCSLDNESNISISFNDVSMSYSGASAEALSDISFSVKRGDTLGIIGGTGSGKSTLINLIPRLYDVTGGSVFVNGIDIKTADIDSLRGIIGIVPQKSVLFKGTIRENMLVGNENASDDDIIEALKISQSHDFVMEKDGQLSYNIEQNGKNLSGGQRQRLTIARALVKKPQILILDDSASALDMATDAALRKAISSLSYKPTTIIVSQRAASVMNADAVLVLDDGKISAFGTHKELLKTSEIYREIYQSQFGKDGE